MFFSIKIRQSQLHELLWDFSMSVEGLTLPIAKLANYYKQQIWLKKFTFISNFLFIKLAVFIF